MNEHVNDTKEPLDEVRHVAEPADGDTPLFVQDDSDYPVDPLDRPWEDGVSTAGNEVPAAPKCAFENFDNVD